MPLCSGPETEGLGWLGLRREGSRRAPIRSKQSVLCSSRQSAPASSFGSRCGSGGGHDRPESVWNSKMLSKRLQACLLMFAFLVATACGSNLETITGSEEQSLGKRRLLQTTPTAGSMFCVAKQGADPTALQTGLNWACGPGHADCTAIQPGGPCYKQNNLPALASYAYNDYYHRNANSGATCNFNGTATTTTTDPSSGQCVFSGSSMAGGNSTTPSANAPSSGFNPPSSFTPGTSTFGSPTGTLIPLDGAESVLSGARRALCVLLLMALPLFFGL